MNDKRQYLPNEFFATFDKLPKVGRAVICGGQAVNLLASVFLNENQIKSLLGSIASATSSDMDIMINEELHAQIFSAAARTSEFSIKTFSDCRQPIQFVILTDNMPETRIDVLRSINGIHTKKDRVFEDSIELEHSPYDVINPTTLLIAKAENCATLDQSSRLDQRNDVTHLRLLIPIVHNYLSALIANCDSSSKAEQREIIRFLKKLHAASEKTNFKIGMNRAKGRFHDCIPIKEIRKSKLETLKNYLEQTFLSGS